MKKLILATAGLATIMGLSGLVTSAPSTAQQPVSQNPPGGPSQERFVVPAAQPPPPAAQSAYLPTTPGFQKLPAPPQSAPGAANANKTSALNEFLKSQKLDEPDINQDIAVQPSCGKWMICVNRFSGSDAARQAREMALELRKNPDYRVPAYVFTNSEERKAELKRIEDNIKQQEAVLKTIPDLPPDTRLHIGVEKSRLETQCAVLVGGYRDMESARRALDQLRKIAQVDPTKVKIFCDYAFVVDENGLPKEAKPLPPFSHALVVANPSLPPERSNRANAEDISVLKRFNAEEEYSLLKCAKRYTLIVKQFALPAYMEPNKESSSLLNMFGLTKPPDNQDRAGFNAHSLAELLHKHKWESYVLHTKYASYVTVGSYDSPSDPRVAHDQDLLVAYSSKLQATMNPHAYESIKLLPRAVVMEVPK